MKVWDLPTRLFHWLLVIALGFSWWSAKSGQMAWHYRSGIAALDLLVFRLAWGVIGSRVARFIEFVKAPPTVVGYLRRGADAHPKPGHNPLGGYSVLAMLTALAVQIGTGLLSVDVDGIESGPLSYRVSFETGRSAAHWHHVSFTALQVLVALHVLAIAYYRVRGRRLVVPMITGRDPQLSATPPASPSLLWLRALGAAAAASAIGWWVSSGAAL